MIHNSIRETIPHQEQNPCKKKLEDLNMMDSFLFDASTEDPEAASVIARTIVKRVTGHELKEFTLENQKQFSGTKFETLPELIMIWILPYDPFGDDRMLYTVKNMVVENNELVYNDGVLKLFLYTGG